MAMKDYPEAQEILQALGRKRLMEVRNSSRLAQQQKENRHHHGGSHHLPDPKGLVDKIKNEAKVSDVSFLFIRVFFSALQEDFRKFILKISRCIF